jgi:hypothetical protein
MLKAAAVIGFADGVGQDEVESWDRVIDVKDDNLLAV